MAYTTGAEPPVAELLAPLPGTIVHMAIDMQRVFAEATAWHMPGFGRIVPNVAAIAEALPERSFFTRFVVPHTAEHAQGQWQTYYRRWTEFTGAVMPPELVDVVDALAPYATPERLIDKLTYSVFEAPDCADRLDALDTTTIIFTGVETDVCVLASLMTAVDRGYRVIAVADALGSSSAEGHHATLTHVLTRLPDQVEIVDTATVLLAIRGRKEGLLF
jgi:nicotinamidase-related amidase